MTADDKFLATAGYLFCAAVIYPTSAGAAIIMVLSLLVIAYVASISDGE